jgi:hypothetical protein
MRKLAIALAISLLPIISISPAEAGICHRYIAYYKKSPYKAGPTTVPVYKRKCSRA